jgi:oligopeptide transport system ATP-binding protein
MSEMLDLRNVTVRLPIDGEDRTVISGVSLTIAPGEALGLVGESGSGKSMTARAVLGTLPRRAERSGAILCADQNVTDLTGDALRRFRASQLGVVFQDPRTAINPVRRIGDFLTEVLCTRGGLNRATANRRALALLGDVGIDNPERRLRQFPHELSGGMLQRVLIAAALASEPSVLLADEPTTALDVTTLAEVMAILDERRRERGMAMLFISHDLDLAIAVCDRIAVMYAGRIVEVHAAVHLRDRPLHPYTRALLDSRPSVEVTARRLEAIPGQPLSAFEAPAGCAFAPRCAHQRPRCAEVDPELRGVDEGLSACLRSEELLLGAGEGSHLA